MVIAPSALDGDIPGAPSAKQKAILTAIATSWEWAALLESCQVENVTELARRVKFGYPYTMRILSLVNLSPDVIEAIVYGREPDGLSLQKLVPGFPNDWEEQGRKLGFAGKRSMPRREQIEAKSVAMLSRCNDFRQSAT